MHTLLLSLLFLFPPPLIYQPLPGTEPRDTTNNYIVIHNDGAGLSAPATRYVLQRRRLSYHFFISRNGTIYQWKKLQYKASHAGVTNYNNLTSWNDFSIGICLQGTSFLPYSENQYLALRSLIIYLNSRYPDSRGKIVGHSDIAFPYGRKPDPGPFFYYWKITDSLL